MSLRLPLPTSPLREKFAISDLLALTPESATTFRQAVDRARNFFRCEPAAKSLSALCVRADGSLWLVEFKRSGAWKRLWVFGNIQTARR